MPIPAQGLPPEKLFRRLERYKEHDVVWRAGKILTGIYDPGRAIVKQAYSSFLTAFSPANRAIQWREPGQTRMRWEKRAMCGLCAS